MVPSYSIKVKSNQEPKFNNCHILKAFKCPSLIISRCKGNLLSLSLFSGISIPDTTAQRLCKIFLKYFIACRASGEYPPQIKEKIEQ